MPFAMTHLLIAHNIIKDTPQIKNPNDFMLGSVAPDSVHNRSNYDSDMKFKSHLCVGNEKWGRVTNNDEWAKNVLAFLDKNRNANNKDFIYGYCCHILADIQNNIKIWTPFRKSIEGNSEKGNMYHEESYIIDYELYLHPERKKIWEYLEKSTAYDINDIVKESEINLMKQRILGESYVDRESIDVSENEYVTLPNIIEFISEESKYIKNILYGKTWL
ncbi:hypothetical protein SH1V18_33730 [Vallitalea longa]|uniref:Phospholipase C/D domain-containing protein n=1 Tax=Vallitalea longa TaxID=2936439 RepID=A0A9W5YEK5_9FIRM|nr:zinc dependent phospholipase C family protein [Vallitalea longa]GKX30893.1 hypothetical protein SH1V18_33730 [Vallitalea longa]